MIITIGKKQISVFCAVFCAGSFFAPLCGQIESDMQETEQIKLQAVSKQETSLEQAALEAYIKAFTPRFFSGKADLDDVRKLLEVLAISPQDHDLSSFFFVVFDRVNEEDRALLLPRLKEILAQNPDNVLLNLNAAEFLYSHNDKACALDYARVAFQLGLTGKSKDKMPDVLRLIAVSKYPLFCMALENWKNLENALTAVRTVPELKDRAEIIALETLIITRKLEKYPPLILPFYRDPDWIALQLSAKKFMERCKTQEKVYCNLDAMRVMPPVTARVLSQQKDFADNLLMLAKKEPAYYLIAADIWLTSEQPLKAAAMQEKYLEQQKKPSMQLLLQTINLLRDSGYPDDAIKLIKKMEPKFHNTDLLVLQKILIYSQKRQPRKALAETLNLPEGFDRSLQQALLLFELKHYPQAYEQIQKAYEYAKTSKRDINVVRFAILYSEMAEKCGDIEGIKKMMTPIIKLNPRNAELLNFLGYVLANHNTDLKQAEKYIETALKYAPDDSAILDSMAWVLYRQKRYEDAAKYMKKAIQMDKKSLSAEIWDHAGDIALAQGHKKDAVICWKNALKVSGELDAATVLKKINENSGK